MSRKWSISRNQFWPRVPNLGSRHLRVLWSPQSIFNDFDIKQSLMFLSRGDFYHPWHTFAALLLWSGQWGQGGGASWGMSPWSPAHHESLGVSTQRLGQKGNSICGNFVSSYVPIQRIGRIGSFKRRGKLWDKYIEYDLLSQLWKLLQEINV